MVTWCQNTVLMYGDKKLLEECFNMFGGNENTIRFNNIVPRPQELSETRSIPSVYEDMQLLRDEAEGKKLSKENKKHLDDIISDGITYRKNAEKCIYCLEHYGFSNWTEWNYKNWGTMWNVNTKNFEFYYEWSTYKGKPSCKFEFYTANTPVLPIVKKLSEMYKELTFHLHAYESAHLLDETYVFQGGELVKTIKN